MVYNKQKL